MPFFHVYCLQNIQLCTGTRGRGVTGAGAVGPGRGTTRYRRGYVASLFGRKIGVFHLNYATKNACFLSFNFMAKNSSLDTGSPDGSIHGIQGEDQVSTTRGAEAAQQVGGLSHDAPEAGGAKDHDLVQPPSFRESVTRGRSEAGHPGPEQV